ncbi:hypothetical protein [Streptomyces albidoflavus]|uniref:hypothetical protein n=1 Tax=Streptomyces albidoflavus TaxID=1886 RepID=UPI0033B4E1C5
MTETPSWSAESWPIAPPSEAEWLRDLCGDGTTGFMPPALPDAAWVLHAMYEHVSGPVEVTYADLHQGGADADRIDPRILAHLESEASDLKGEHPGPDWRRLRWSELAERTGDPLVPEGGYPSHHCFPSAGAGNSWPVSLWSPAEGCLDRPSWNRLIDILTAYSPDGPDTRTLAHHSLMNLLGGSADVDLPAGGELGLVCAGHLRDAKSLYDSPYAECNPANLFAADHSWITNTDIDLWATKVVGPPPLINALLNDTEIEAVRLPWKH